MNPRKQAKNPRWSRLSPELQWGRGFESTETRRILPTENPICRRFNGAVDLNPRKPSWPSHVSSALTICFNGAVDLNPRKPRPSKSRAAKPRLLQWGRGFESTETQVRESDRGPRHALQWGRGFESTETHTAGRKLGARPRRFNGAVDLNPRKLAGLEDGHQCTPGASMGPWI